MLDPACPDITGRALEALAANGYDRSHPACQTPVDYLVRSQEGRPGSWCSRWGVAYLYGTCFALRSLRAMGEDDHEPHVQRANVQWIRSLQNADGGWGRKLRQLREQCVCRGGGEHSKPDGLGADGADGGWRYVQFQRAGWHPIPGEDPTGRTIGWLEELATGTGFPTRCSTLITTTTGFTSR